MASPEISVPPVGADVVREAAPADWQEYRDIRLEMLRLEPTAYESTLVREQPFDESVWRDRLAADWTFLAYDRDALVGTATGLWDGTGDTIVIAMYVRAAARRRGAATALLDTLVRKTEARHGVALRLRVTEGNTAAADCYARYGFVDTGQRPSPAHGPSRVEIEMRLELPKRL